MPEAAFNVLENAGKTPEERVEACEIFLANLQKYIPGEPLVLDSAGKQALEIIVKRLRDEFAETGGF